MTLQDKINHLYMWIDINTLVDEQYKQSAKETCKKILEITYSIQFNAQNGNLRKAHYIANKYMNVDFYPVRG